MKSKLLIKLLSLLGFSTVAASCEQIEEIIGGGGAVCMYGTPSASYVFNVEVKESTGDTPIEGIRVCVIDRHNTYNPETGEHDIPHIDTLQVGTTDANGKATLFLDHTWPLSKHEIAADDIDGGENGGEFKSAIFSVNTSSEDYKNPGKEGWFEGTATHNVLIGLSKKEE